MPNSLISVVSFMVALVAFYVFGALTIGAVFGSALGAMAFAVFFDINQKVFTQLQRYIQTESM